MSICLSAPFKIHWIVLLWIWMYSRQVPDCAIRTLVCSLCVCVLYIYKYIVHYDVCCVHIKYVLKILSFWIYEHFGTLANCPQSVVNKQPFEWIIIKKIAANNNCNQQWGAMLGIIDLQTVLQQIDSRKAAHKAENFPHPDHTRPPVLILLTKSGIRKIVRTSKKWNLDALFSSMFSILVFACYMFGTNIEQWWRFSEKKIQYAACQYFVSFFFSFWCRYFLPRRTRKFSHGERCSVNKAKHIHIE